MIPTVTVPDSMQGAIILSVIDFILSLLVISGIGFVLALFPLLNRLGTVDEQALRKGEN